MSKDKHDDITSISAIFDIKAETLAATFLSELMKSSNDMGVDQILISPIGNEKRRIRNDVDRVKEKSFESDKALLLEVNRKGMFDLLPDGLFLRLEEDYENAKERTKAISEQIAEARKFFLPFEQALYHPKIEAEQLEQKYTEKFPEFIYKIWGLDQAKYLDDRQRFLLCYLIPEAYRVVGNWELTELIFEEVIRKPITLDFVAPKVFEFENNSSMNELKLGDNSIVGNSFRDDIPALEIIVKGITNQDLFEYLPGGDKRKLIDEILCAFFIPLDVPYHIEIVVTDDAMDFDMGQSVLGYSMKLNSN